MSEEFNDEADLDLDNMKNPSRFHIKKGSFILVHYASEKNANSKSFFVGVALEDPTEDNTVEVKFMKCLPTSVGNQRYAFVYPEEVDTDRIDIDNIELLLPKPMAAGGTSRAANRFIFMNVDLSSYF